MGMGIGRITLGSLVVIAIAASPLVLAAIVHPTPVNWRELRFEPEVSQYQALSGREDAPRGGRTEMEFLAQYERLDTPATEFSQGYRQGRSTGQQMGADRVQYRYGTSAAPGYRHGYGGRAGDAIRDAQALANATGEPDDVIVG